MVFESLISPIKAERRPWEMVFIAFLYNTLAIFISWWVFRQYASLVMVFLTTMFCIPIVYNTIKYEEKKDESQLTESVLLKEHGKALSTFIFLFIGVTLSVALWYVLLPNQLNPALFSVQTETINAINSGVTGGVVKIGLFTKIFYNNLKVLLFCIFFALVFGFGAIFVLMWNASIIGTALGNFIRNGISKIAETAGSVTVGNYFHVVSLGLLRYSIHGIPEIVAYFTAGLAGGIISIAIIRHQFETEKCRKVILDSVDLIVISVILLFVAALLEVYVTPLLF